MPNEGLTADQLLFLVGLSAEAKAPPLPTLDRLVAFSMGRLGVQEADAVVDAAVAFDAVRYQLAEVHQLVEALERGTTILNPDARQQQIVEAWQRHLSPLRHNLGAERRPFVGREADQARLSELLSGAARLVTLTGAGGMGKSRLARKVALGLLDQFPDGVWQIDCALLSEGRDLYAAIAKVLGLDGGDLVEGRVQEVLHGKRILLLLDGLEKRPALRREVPKLLEAPALKILATAQAPTRLDLETVHRLTPMHEDAIALFVEAARQVVRDFQLTARNRFQVQTLCRRLMGVPLALTVAASCLAHQDLPDLLRNVEGQTSAVSIRQTVADSFRLLAEHDRLNLRQLSVFAGPFTLEDAQAVLAENGSLASILEGLEARGLLETFNENGVTAYRLLDSVGQYLADIEMRPSEESILKVCQIRHAARYAHKAEQIGTAMSEGHWARGIAELSFNQANLRQAVQHSIQTNNTGALTQLADGLTRTYFEAGYLTDFDTLARAGSKLGDDALRIRLLGLQGALASLRSDEPTCERLWKRRLRLARQANDIYAVADTLTDLAWQAADLDNAPLAFEYLSESETLSEQAGIWELVATAHVIRARIHVRTGETEAALHWVHAAESLLPRCKVRELLPFVHQNIGIVYKALNHEPEAIQAILTLLGEAHEGRRAVLTGWALRELGPIFEQQGELDWAARCLVAAVAIHNEYATKHRVRAEEAYQAFRARYGEEMEGVLSALESAPLDQIVEEVLTRRDSLQRPDSTP